MPFDGSGTASIVNSFTPSTVISSSQVNANFSDIATMLTNTLPRDGQAAMTGQLKATDGTVGAPGITFGGDLDNGAYRTGANAWSLAVGGAQALAFATTGITHVKPMLWTKGADLTSAATLVIGTDGNYFDVAGNTGPVTAMTVAAGTLFMLQFDSTPTLTHHATNLNLPGAANITAAAGDRAICFAEAANQVRVVEYIKASGLPIKVDGTIIRMGSDAQGDVLYFNGTNYVRLGAGTSGQFLQTQGAGANPQWASQALVPLSRVTSAAAASYDFTAAAAFNGTYRTLKLIGWLQPATDDVELWIRVSDDGGATYEADAADYQYQCITYDNASVARFRASASDVKIAVGAIDATFSVGNAADERIQFEITLNNPNSTAFRKLFDISAVWSAATGALMNGKGSGMSTATAAVNGLQLLFESGNIAAGDVTLYGVANA